MDHPICPGVWKFSSEEAFKLALDRACPMRKPIPDQPGFFTYEKDGEKGTVKVVPSEWTFYIFFSSS